MRSTLRLMPPRLSRPGLLLRIGWLCCLILGLILSIGQAATAQDESARVYVLRFEGAVTPVLESYLGRAIDEAAATGAEAVILQLDTPGGSVEVTKSIMQRMLIAPVPVVVYVSPVGAHAGSAGTFITLAAHVAAMAPSTSIGAASPVGGSGEDIGETMAAKVTNILSADIENLAARRGEAATEWAIAAVQEAAAATASQALEIGVIDFVASDIDDLLEQMDGFEVMLNGQPHVLRTAQATLRLVELTPVQRAINFLTDPSVASILLSLGVLGLIIEIRTPGFGVPGVLGLICLFIAFYALGQLDANFTGLALIGVAFILFIAEAFTPTFGVLALGGAVAFVIGAILLFDTPGVRVPWLAIIGTSLTLAAFSVFVGYKALAAQSRPVITGIEGMIGQTGTAKLDFAAGEPGSVFVAGEWWNAELTHGEVRKDERVRVVGLEGYTLRVEPLPDAVAAQRTDPAQV